MDLGSKSYLIHVSQALPPSTTPGSSIFGTPIHHSDTSFPIIAVAGIGIVATAFLLVGYYIFVIKCCLNWHRVDILRRFSLSRNRRDEDQLMVYSPRVETRGLDEAVIRSIPLLQFKKDGNYIGLGEGSFCECAVCLNEFQEDEKLRIIPNCSHVFHIDCIDVWLQSNANCPLCRTSISTTPRFPFDRTVAPSSSPQDPSPYAGSLSGGDEDYVVIELSNDNTMDQAMLGRQGRSNSGELSLSVRSISPSPRKLEHRVLPKKFERKFHNMITSMGDECIDIRGKDDQFSIQPIRRSFSMDSSADRQLYLAVQAAMQQQRQISEVSPTEGCSRGRVRRSFFSFGNGRGSRNAILPVYLEP